MSLKIKTSADLERLREFGFVPGEELAHTPQFSEYFDGRGYQLPWWHKFEEDPDNPGWPNCDEDGLPLVHAWVDTRDEKNLLWFDVVPCCTYHAGMSDLDLITDTVLNLTRAGLIEGGEAEVDVIRKALADWRPELNHIIEALGTEELLAQLAEEAAELGKDCRNRYYTKCDECGVYHFDDDMTKVYRPSGSAQVCPGCLSEHFEECRGCGEFYETCMLEDGLCPDCAAETPTSEGLADDDNNETEVSA